MLKEGYTPGVYAQGMSGKGEIGRKLWAHRNRTPKITLEQVSDATRGIYSQARISNYEQDRRAMDQNDAKAISEAYASLGRPISVAEILQIKVAEVDKREYRGGAAHQDPDLNRIAKVWPTLSDDSKENILAIIDRAVSHPGKTKISGKSKHKSH